MQGMTTTGKSSSSSAGPRRLDGFDTIITPDDNSGGTLAELWEYRDLIYLFVRRNFVAHYKQTVLGPAWAVLQPLVSTLITAAVFGGLAKLSPGGVPTFLFYLSGQVLWNFFSSCLNTTANTFVNNANIMGKVYFPRFVMPVAGILTQFISFVIQAALFCLFVLVFALVGNPITPDATLLLMPLYVAHLALLALGLGALASSFTTRFRDVVILISYGITLLMYVSPVVYDISIVPESLRFVYLLNPIAPIFVHVRSALFGLGEFCWLHYVLSLVVTGVVLVSGYKTYTRVAKTFVDTI